jgi:cation transport ATPase
LGAIIHRIRKGEHLNKMRKLLIYPSFFDLALIVALYLATKSLLQEFYLALTVVIIVVILRFILAWAIYGVLVSHARNWYIKQFIYIFIGVLVAYIYSFQQFSWVFATYFASASLVEVIFSLKRSKHLV